MVNIKGSLVFNQVFSNDPGSNMFLLLFAYPLKGLRELTVIKKYMYEHYWECYSWCQQNDVSNFFLSTFQANHPVGGRDSINEMTQLK